MFPLSLLPSLLTVAVVPVLAVMVAPEVAVMAVFPAVAVVLVAVSAVTAAALVKLLKLLSNPDTMLNSVMFHPLVLLPQPPSKLAPTLSQSPFSSDLPLPP